MKNQERYSRQTQLASFGKAAQQKLQQAKVLVVGAGGLGVPVLQYLAGMGVGTIGIIDNDRVSLTNLQRQVLYFETDIGKPKVEVATQKLSQLNSTISLTPYFTKLTVQNALGIIQNYDVVIDATDTFEARYLINDACVILGKPFVYGAVQQFEGQVAVFNYKQGPTYRCLYPKPPAANEIPDCNAAGVLGVVPGIIGCRQALEAVKVITGVGEPLSGYLQIFDFLDSSEYKIKLKAREENRNIHSLQSSYITQNCSTVVSIHANELQEWFASGKEFYLLDVREPQEYVQYHLKNALLMPLPTLPSQLSKLPDAVPLITVCERGSRSMQAASLLVEAGHNAEVRSLEGGMQQWLAHHGNELICP